jgi:hypothetical protein
MVIYINSLQIRLGFLSIFSAIISSDFTDMTTTPPISFLSYQNLPFLSALKPCLDPLNFYKI